MNNQLYPKSRELLPAGKPIAVGQRLYWGMSGGHYGIVVAINDAYGERATVDVVFEESHLKAVPESIVRGVQWSIFDEVATSEEIDEAVAVCKGAVAEKEMLKQLASQRREAERKQHLENNPHLRPISQTDRWSPGRCAAYNIRIELRKLFPNVKFSVRSDFNSVDIHWDFGPTTREVEAITGKYVGGSFNGMEDIYETDVDATFAQVFGNPKYVFCHRSFGKGNASIDAVGKGYFDLYKQPYPGISGLIHESIYVSDFANKVLHASSFTCSDPERIVITGLSKKSPEQRGLSLESWYNVEYVVSNKSNSRS